MLPPSRSKRVVFPLVAVGILLLLISVFLVGRDLAFARGEAETEVVALAESGALAIQFAPANEIEPYLSELLKHPAIEVATVYSSDGQRMMKSRPSGIDSPLLKRFAPWMGEAV